MKTKQQFKKELKITPKVEKCEPKRNIQKKAVKKKTPKKSIAESQNELKKKRESVE